VLFYLFWPVMVMAYASESGFESRPGHGCSSPTEAERRWAVRFAMSDTVLRKNYRRDLKRVTLLPI
jgi:hypothetical protein